MEKFVNAILQLPTKKQIILLAVLGLLFYVPFLGNVHLFDWDEINFAEIAREMRVTGDYFSVQINYQPFYEKPPLFGWIQNVSYSLFGINEFAARFPNALFGVFTLIIIYLTGRKIKGNAFGLMWALLFFGSILPHLFYKTGIIDPVFNFFIFSSIVYSIVLLNEPESKGKHFFFAGIINGLGILAKGPVALLILLLTFFFYWLTQSRKRNFIPFKNMVMFGLGVSLMAGLWFGPEMIRSGPGFIVEFVTYMIGLLSQDIATHGQPFYYHFIVIFIGCFPISIFALKNILKTSKSEKYNFNVWMLILFWVVLILFSIVKTKIVNYSSMTYFPLSYLATYSIFQYQENKEIKFDKLFLGMGLLLSLVFIAFPIVLNYKEALYPLLAKDPFAIDTLKIMEMPTSMSFIGIILLAGVLWAFYFFRKKQIITGAFVFAIINAIVFNLNLNVIVPYVEKAVQGPAIEFYERFEGQDVYLETIGFKSYGKLFYFKKPIPESYKTEHELLYTDLDKDAYFVSKTKKNRRLEEAEDIELVEKKGGYFLYYKPKK